MNKRRLGKTDIEVTPIGLGCWQFSQGQGIIGKYWSILDQETITSVVKTALDNGVSWFDTAEAYGRGKSEQALAKALKDLGVASGSVVVATKWFPLFRTAGSLHRTIDERLANLDGYPIDLYQIHHPTSFSSVSSQMRGMAELLRAGKIRSIGISNFSAAQMEQAHAALAAEGIVLASNQVRYSLLDRKIEYNGIMETARRLGVSVIAYSPLAQGALTGKYHDDPSLAAGLTGPRKFMGTFGTPALSRIAPLVDELRAIGKSYGVTPSQVALNWLVNFQGDTVVAIPGASAPRHAEESAGALSFRLNAKELQRLDEVSRQLTVRSSALGHTA
jgi:aryl-alcohol dehydrogenase-like predicted oxidoreductase